MKKIIFLLAVTLLFTAACGKKAPKETPDLWYKNASFLKSVQLSDAAGVQGIISTTNINLNSPDEEGRGALHYAIETTRNENLIAAIAAAPSIDLAAKDERGYDAITLAAAANTNEEVFLALVMAGAKPGDLNALLEQSYKNTNVLVPGMVGKLIIKTPWDKNAAFIEALQKDNYEQLRRQLPFTDIHRSAAPQQTAPLFMAVAGGGKDIIPLLVKYGADVNQYMIPAQKTTPLLYAAASRPLAIIDALIRAGADINAQDVNGMAPLMAAVKSHPESSKAAALLLKNKADISLADNNGDTALAIAALYNKTPENILPLIRAGAKVEAKNKKQYTPLLLAATYNNDESITEALLAEKADMSAVNDMGFTALALAANQNPNEKVAQALIANGAALDAKTPQGYTPLMLAAANNQNEKIIQALLTAGADTGDLQQLVKYAEANKSQAVKDLIKQLLPPEPPKNSKSKKAWYNNDAFADAVQKGDAKALRAALKSGINVDVLYAGPRSITALMYAIAHTQSEEIISTLIKAGADVNDTNQSGDTALMVAALVTKNPKIIDALLKAGADVNAKDSNGVNALMSAAASNPEEGVISELLNAGAETKNIGALIEAANKNPNKKIKELLQKLR